MRLLKDREHERERRLGVIRAKIDVAAEDPARISADEVDRHFAQRFAEARKMLPQIMNIMNEEI